MGTAPWHQDDQAWDGVTTLQVRLLVVLVALGTAALGIEESIRPTLDWPRSIEGFAIGGITNFIAAFALMCFAITMSRQCRLIGTAALLSSCVTDSLGTVMSNLDWAERVGHIGGCVAFGCLVLLASFYLRKAAIGGL